MYWAYIPRNPEGRFYIGHTDDLQRRVCEHNEPHRTGTKYTAKSNGPWELVWSEEHSDRAIAMRREKQIKAMKSANWIREHLLQSNSKLLLNCWDMRCAP